LMPVIGRGEAVKADIITNEPLAKLSPFGGIF
jgi:hypothetical protein